jgi:hypothetical protein
MNPNPIRLTTLMAAAALASAAFIAAAPAHAAAPAAAPAVQQVIVTAKRLPKAEALPVHRVIVTAKRLPRGMTAADAAASGASGSGSLRPTAAPAR